MYRRCFNNHRLQSVNQIRQLFLFAIDNFTNSIEIFNGATYIAIYVIPRLYLIENIKQMLPSFMKRHKVFYSNQQTMEAWQHDHRMMS